ncbi:integrase family protein [Desulfofarcimen acetoxidans DSM 771]|uniref:Integrase family protein n=1 Tax=Desulfofarcimen acetoxidans (strain ATCC 49208 / DSM 771 / KCTC 5769 / VKM B-1644 / 5575) TaxID=485916 RepID=C8VZS7_DESAS|nr:tyrosine-type recombinase/integrase [Desulfofarcimen acetoxidans]ACV63055.1 integrase family protein [Desulfofarcimen acetoxidans DSM 771]
MKNKGLQTGTLFFSMTLEFLETYLPRQLGRSSKTIKSYKDSLTVFRRYLYDECHISVAAFKFADCNQKCIQEFIIYLKDNNNSPGTCNQRLTALKSYLWFAADRDIAVQSVALSISKIPQCKIPKKEKETLTEEALAAILQQPPNTKMGLRDRVIMILLYDSAVRLDELLCLTLKDLSLRTDNPYIRISGKGNKERIVAITPKTAEHLKQYLSVYHKNDLNMDQYLFITRIKGVTDRMSPGNVERFIKQYANSAREKCLQIPLKVYPHMFRRTRATDLYQNGVELELVSRILGHSSTETTKVYAKPSIEMLRKAIESVEIPEQTNEEPLWTSCNEEEMAKLCGLR